MYRSKSSEIKFKMKNKKNKMKRIKFKVYKTIRNANPFKTGITGRKVDHQ